MHRLRPNIVPRKNEKETAMKQSRPIEVIQPTLRRSARKRHISLANVLTAGAALLAIVLSVSLSSAANTNTCAMPLAGELNTPCD